ncbi:hypothetical protein [Nocardioides sp.]|uniref:hypothetical protein n=1 Tax=Nocardioides sp. TaxID=35761 RepID=UPI002D17D2D3|nr:hypothetical protein [Nocardioides sp.]HXH78028.1 hypothetical protein [Nocardioides sp.]
MAIRKSRKWWTADVAEDLGEYLAEYSASLHRPVGTVAHAQCEDCGSSDFGVRVDDDEGCAQRTCSGCGRAAWIFDSADAAQDAELDDATCPCGSATFNVAGGFSLRDDGDIDWVFVGLRCTTDGVLGCYTDWKIDYSPTAHLLTQVSAWRAGISAPELPDRRRIDSTPATTQDVRLRLQTRPRVIIMTSLFCIVAGALLIFIDSWFGYAPPAYGVIVLVVGLCAISRAIAAVCSAFATPL